MTANQEKTDRCVSRLSASEINDVIDLAECCVHDKISNPAEREFVQNGLKKLRALALSETTRVENPEEKDVMDRIRRCTSLDEVNAIWEAHQREQRRIDDAVDGDCA